MTGCMCADCKHNEIVIDNHYNNHYICTCAESDYFLKPIDLFWGECDSGEVEMEDTE
jgi:hypothetical protein